MASRKQLIVHEIADGFCTVCGSNVEFLAYTDQAMVDAETREPVTVDPAVVQECFGLQDA